MIFDYIIGIFNWIHLIEIISPTIPWPWVMCSNLKGEKGGGGALQITCLSFQLVCGQHRVCSYICAIASICLFSMAVWGGYQIIRLIWVEMCIGKEIRLVYESIHQVYRFSCNEMYLEYDAYKWRRMSHII